MLVSQTICEFQKMSAMGRPVMDWEDQIRNAKGRCKKKTGKCGNFEKTGGGSTRIPLPCFTVFNMGEPPKKVLKCKKKT